MTTHPSTEEEGPTTINKTLKDVSLPVAVMEELDMTGKNFKNATFPLAEEEGTNITGNDITLPLVEEEGPNIIGNEITLPLVEEEGPKITSDDMTLPLAEVEGSSIIGGDASEIMSVPGDIPRGVSVDSKSKQVMSVKSIIIYHYII